MLTADEWADLSEHVSDALARLRALPPERRGADDRAAIADLADALDGLCRGGRLGDHSWRAVGLALAAEADRLESALNYTDARAVGRLKRLEAVLAKVGPWGELAAAWGEGPPEAPAEELEEFFLRMLQ